jgi:hypothetical protein
MCDRKSPTHKLAVGNYQNHIYLPRPGANEEFIRNQCAQQTVLFAFTVDMWLILRRVTARK